MSSQEQAASKSQTTAIQSEADQLNPQEPKADFEVITKPQESWRLAFVCFIVPLVLVIIVMIIGLATAGKGIVVSRGDFTFSKVIAEPSFPSCVEDSEATALSNEWVQVYTQDQVMADLEQGALPFEHGFSCAVECARKNAGSSVIGLFKYSTQECHCRNNADYSGVPACVSLGEFEVWNTEQSEGVEYDHAAAVAAALLDSHAAVPEFVKVGKFEGLDEDGKEILTDGECMRGFEMEDQVWAPMDGTFESGEKCAISAVSQGVYWVTYNPATKECNAKPYKSIDDVCGSTWKSIEVETWRTKFPHIYHYGPSAYTHEAPVEEPVVESESTEEAAPVEAEAEETQGNDAE